MERPQLEKIQKSIRENGYDMSEPIRVHKGTNIIENGHHRQRGAILERKREVSVVDVEVTPEDLAIAESKAAAVEEWYEGYFNARGKVWGQR